MKGVKGQVSIAIGMIIMVLIAIGLILFLFTQLRQAPSGLPAGLPAALEETIATTEIQEKTSIEKEFGIKIEEGLDVVHLVSGSFYTITYSNVDKQFVIIVDGPEDKAREEVANWFKSKGVEDLNQIPIYWHIKPPTKP